MNITFFEQLEVALATERLGAYRQDKADEVTTLARYLLNMALCESLYSPLQFAEVALRNAVHASLCDRFDSEGWYDAIPSGKLLPWQAKQIIAAKDKLARDDKTENPGRIIAELHFGFWTGFFNRRHARTGLGFALTNSVFSGAPKSERALANLDARWNRIRILRNRVFHHERILHWTDLDDQHRALLQVTGWISPELRELADALDRYTQIRSEGLSPWIEQIQNHWPQTRVGHNLDD
ncbi:MAG: hypothetical protein HN919_09035 [Verrucomicrobia bacterium]|jgi:hypothetical protein|nr:hypothetical protein [Verrucomicrobiota bacterium]